MIYGNQFDQNETKIMSFILVFFGHTDNKFVCLHSFQKYNSCFFYVVLIP
jgi:hypothetical protein